ncbi:response regulator [Desulfovibrio sulfodismutans]|uniref:histidine kinase n=1 Tax=Desulfolutivibrio sulfodismutans TaxID=63561 RepID=A0A7K3NK82_9BACT|nr:ATP-binding protein [Desulfolutivibrio sulfodismutans]NDY56611.1 response regulator [Desulfolutivibrio sulfodismutans]QLA13068.1 response regulator [Desulfolutivibrio sulfodismutans DSM 3696]
MSKLFRKTLVAIVILFGVVANASALLSAFILYTDLTDEYETKGRAIAGSIAEASVEILQSRDASTVQAMIDKFLDIEGVGYVYVLDNEARIISHTFVPGIPDEIQKAQIDPSGFTVKDVDLPGIGGFIQISAPILAGVAGTVSVGMAKNIIHAKIRAAVIQQELLMLFMLAVAVVVFFMLIKGISRPLMELSEYAQKLRAHDFSARIIITSDDEVGLLAATMNSMADELSDLVSGLERAVAASTRELQGALAHMRAIMDNMADGLLVTDAHGRITNVNPPLVHMFGLEGADLTGKDARQLFSGAMAELPEAARTAQTAILTAEVRLGGGRVGKAAASAIHSHADGSAGPDAVADDAATWLGTVILVRDITSEKEVDRMKTEFISTVSHELRTPLTSVLGFAKIIRKKFVEDILPRLDASDNKSRRAAGQIGDNLGIIVSEGERLTELVNDVLDIAKMESGKIEWDLQPVTIAEVITRSVTATSALIEQKGLSLAQDVSFGLPQFLGDRDRLIQVMLNLISNAVKFTAAGGITIRAFIDGEMIRVGVSDTGPGISENDQQIIFEKFKQAGDTLTEKPKGTGLGLPICRQIVDRHGGRIWVESTPGAGSVFWFTLPIRGASRQDAAHPVQQPAFRDRLLPLPAEKNQGTILVVDDEPPVRLFLEQLLADEGFRVLSASDGPQAIEMAKAHAPDLITMDLMMPGMDGTTTIRHLRADPATRDIPVVVISALPAREREQAGGDACMVKPVDESALIETIVSLLRGAGKDTRPCMVLKRNGAESTNPLLMICPGKVQHTTREELWKRLEEGFSGTVFIPGSISHEMDLARLSAHPNIHVVIFAE